jgi:hypothetical protein
MKATVNQPNRNHRRLGFDPLITTIIAQSAKSHHSLLSGCGPTSDPSAAATCLGFAGFFLPPLQPVLGMGGDPAVRQQSIRGKPARYTRTARTLLLPQQVLAIAGGEWIQRLVAGRALTPFR